MSIISWLIIGGLAGWIASIITKRNTQMGMVANVVVGIIGGLLGGFILDLLGGTGLTGFSLWSLIVAVFGAVILLAIVNSIKGGSKPSSEKQDN